MPPSLKGTRTGEAIIAVFFNVLVTLRVMDFITRTVMGTLTGLTAPEWPQNGNRLFGGGGSPGIPRADEQGTSA